MSHVKNLQSFDQVIGICTGLGGNYNPGKQNLQVNAMTTLLNSALQINEEMMDARNDFNLATNNRALSFRALPKISSGVISMLKASGANPLTIQDAIRSNRKIQGRTARQAVEQKVEGEVSKHISTHGHDFATMADNFGALVKTISSEPKYSPYEPQLTVEALKQKLAELQSMNATVTQTGTNLGIIRRKRDHVYYTGDESLVSTAVATKYYVRSVFGLHSAQHTVLKRIRFTKPHA